MKDNYREVNASPERGSELDRLSRLLGVARINDKGESDRPDFQIDTAQTGHLINHLRFISESRENVITRPSTIQYLLRCKAFSSIARVGYLTRKSINRVKNLPREILAGMDRHNFDYIDVGAKSRCVSNI